MSGHTERPLPVNNDNNFIHIIDQCVCNAYALCTIYSTTDLGYTLCLQALMMIIAVLDSVISAI